MCLDDDVATGFSCAENHFLCSPCLFQYVQSATENDGLMVMSVQGGKDNSEGVSKPGELPW